MNRFLIAAATLALGASAAQAADMPARIYTKTPVIAEPAPTWTGGYVGVNAGYAWGDPTGNLGSYSPPFNVAVVGGALPTNYNIKPDGGFGGGQAGYNWQVTTWLVGLETDIQGANIGGTSTLQYPGGALVPTNSAARDHIGWFGTLRGRAGVTAGNVLFYGTGGLAYGGVNASASTVGNPPASGNFQGSTSETRFGWAAGAGIEWGFARSWSLKAEYLHVDLGTSNVQIADPAYPTSFASYSFRNNFDTVRVGVNYLFGAPGVARY